MIQELRHHHDQAGAWDVLRAAKGTLAFDVGANIGQASRVLAQGFVNVVAFEPCRESYEILKAEMPPNVVTREIAVTSHDGTLTLSETAEAIRTGQLTTGEGLHWGPIMGSREVPCLTLDSLAEEFGFPDMLKIDVEGHEVEVVRGGMSVFEKEPQVIIEVHRAEHEQVIRGLLPWDWTKLTHHSGIDSFIRENHFWIVSQ